MAPRDLLFPPFLFYALLPPSYSRVLPVFPHPFIHFMVSGHRTGNRDVITLFSFRQLAGAGSSAAHLKSLVRVLLVPSLLGPLPLSLQVSYYISRPRRPSFHPLIVLGQSKDQVSIHRMGDGILFAALKSLAIAPKAFSRSSNSQSPYISSASMCS